MREEGYTDFGLQPPVQRVHPPEGPRDVASLIDWAVARCPDNEALVDATNRYSFGELGRLVENMAALFDDHGVKTGDRIAASLGNDNAIVIAFFAAMRLGAIWVGINKILPADEKHFILSHSGAKLLITDSGIEPPARIRNDLGHRR
jgi:long-chain acyl-CoA synthetase